MSWLFEIIGDFLFDSIGSAVGSLRARRRRRRLRRGGTVQVRSRLAVGPERPRRGRLLLSQAHVAWHERRGPAVHELTGAAIRSQVGADREGDAVLALALPGHPPLSLTLSADDAVSLAEVLHAQRPTH